MKFSVQWQRQAHNCTTTSLRHNNTKAKVRVIYITFPEASIVFSIKQGGKITFQFAEANLLLDGSLHMT